MLVKIILPYDFESHLEEIAALSESRNRDFKEKPKKKVDNKNSEKREK